MPCVSSKVSRSSLPHASAYTAMAFRSWVIAQGWETIEGLPSGSGMLMASKRSFLPLVSPLFGSVITSARCSRSTTLMAGNTVV